MHFRRLSLGALIIVSAASAATPRIEDPARILAASVVWTARETDKLTAFEQKTGIRILVQYHPQSPPDAEDRVDGQYMTTLSTRLGTVDHGILMVYFADDGSWRVWIGNLLTPSFVGKPGDARQFTASGEMHQAKEAYLDRAKARADAAYGQRHSPAKVSDTERRTPEYLALWSDALIDGLTTIFADQRRRRE